MSENYPDGVNQAEFDRAWNELGDVDEAEECSHGVSFNDECEDCDDYDDGDMEI